MQKSSKKVQKRATKLVISVKKIHYKDRLRQLKLLRNIMDKRRWLNCIRSWRENMITVRDKWITGKCIGKQNNTRNHRFALQQSHVHYAMRKFSFSNRIIPIWNSIGDSSSDMLLKNRNRSLDSSPTTNTFRLFTGSCSKAVLNWQLITSELWLE